MKEYIVEIDLSFIYSDDTDNKINNLSEISKILNKRIKVQANGENKTGTMVELLNDLQVEKFKKVSYVKGVYPSSELTFDV